MPCQFCQIVHLIIYISDLLPAKNIHPNTLQKQSSINVFNFLIGILSLDKITNVTRILIDQNGIIQYVQNRKTSRTDINYVHQDILIA